MLPNRTFGVEIECILPEGQTMAQAASFVAERARVVCAAETYNHRVSQGWKVVTDGSLGDYRHGCEFVSPVLSGEAGLDEIARVCVALTAFGCKVNQKCGYHVHVGAGDRPSIDFFKTLVKMYAAFEPVLDLMMPPSRRRSANTFCRTMTTISEYALNRARGIDELVPIRYMKLNTLAFRKHKTVEFRHHSGTVDEHKAVMWARICLRMVEAAASRQFDFGSGQLQNHARRSSKCFQVGEMLLRPQGVTAAEVRAFSGWQSFSMNQVAGICGIPFVQERRGREMHYRAVAPRTGSLEITAVGLANAVALEPAEYQFVVDRQASHRRGEAQIAA